MKYLKQFFIIILITFFSELLSLYLPLPIPASIYGIFILFLFLITGILKLEQIEETANLFLQIMPALFVVSATGLINSYSSIVNNFLSWTIANVVATLVIISVTAVLSQMIIKKSKRRKGKC